MQFSTICVKQSSLLLLLLLLLLLISIEKCIDSMV